MSINLDELLSKNVEGFNQDLFNWEKQKVKNSMTKEVGDLMYPLT